jgi:Secretion system C-terminal sorting domain
MKQLLFINLLCIYAIQMNAQTECYIKYTYDDSGNRIKREFICAERDTILPGNPIGSRMAKPTVAKPFDVNVYPNPSNGIFTIACSMLEKNMQLQVINYAGQTVYTQSLIQIKTDIDISNMASGLYTFIIKSNLNVESRRVVKEGR